jgi:aryl-alcohol dehydrogenase-like predicted oxidoreductase
MVRTLRTAQLGTTGQQIARVGFGAWAIGGGGWEARRHDTTPGAVAIAWTLRNPAADAAIVGFRRPDQVDPLLAAADLDLTAEDLAEIGGGSE